MTRPRVEKTMTIPEVRARLYAMAEALDSAELRRLTDQLWRRPAWRRPVRPVSPQVTPELAEEVRAYVEAHPDEPEDRVGDHFGLNQGRVSEIMAGFR